MVRPVTFDEWCQCDAPLPVRKCNAYRELAGLPPIERPNAKRGRAAHKSASQKIDYKPLKSNKYGVGDALKELLQSLGVDASFCEGCQKRRERMNKWGVQGCLKNLDEIAGWLKAAAATAGPKVASYAAWRAVLTGTWVSPLTPFRGLAERAIAMTVDWEMGLSAGLNYACEFEVDATDEQLAAVETAHQLAEAIMGVSLTPQDVAIFWEAWGDTAECVATITNNAQFRTGFAAGLIKSRELVAA